MRLPPFIIGLAVFLPALMLWACTPRPAATTGTTQEEAFPRGYDGSGGGGGGGGGM